MDIAIASHFHNAESYLGRYLEQMLQLQVELQERGDSLTLLLGYGDCTDATEEILRDETSIMFDARIIDVSHGGKVFGSVVDKQRFIQLAGIGNKLWEAIPDYATMVGLIESDLAWKPASILRLIDGATSLADAIKAPTLLAPMVKRSEGQKSPFYDTWAFRLNGRNFRSTYPYHPALRTTAEYIELDSVGSCFFTQAVIAKELTWPKEDVVVGLCRKAKKLGARVFLDTQAEVYHL